MAYDLGGCIGSDVVLRMTDHGDCLACKLRGSIYVLLTLGEQMRERGQLTDFSTILTDVAHVVSTGDAAPIDRLMDVLMAMPCQPVVA